MTEIENELRRLDEQIAKHAADLTTCEPSKAVDLAQRLGVLQATRDALALRLESDQQAARVKDAVSLGDDLKQARKRMDAANAKDAAANQAKQAARDVLNDAAQQYRRFHDADHLEKYLAAFCAHERALLTQSILTDASLAALKVFNETEGRLQHAQAALAA